MNYYTIPKNTCPLQLQLKTSDELTPYISYSVFDYINDIQRQLKKVKYENNIDDEFTIDYINKIVNPFEFIHTVVPGSSISVSKVKPESKIFFELMELLNLFSINDIFSSKHRIHIAHLTPNHSSSNYLLNMYREDNADTVLCCPYDYKLLCDLFINREHDTKFDLLICELNEQDYEDIQTYTANMLLLFSIIVKYQSPSGVCIIKIDNMFFKPIIDIIFALTTLYDKVNLIKPIISDVSKSERYVVCKSFNTASPQLLADMSKIDQLLTTQGMLCQNSFISSIIENDLSYFFLNKLEESNAVIGQQQLEAYDQIINIYKNKNKEDKVETLKRNHIQKCINWCEKYQLPHNKFIDKINIFLNNKRKMLENKEVDMVL